MGVMIRSLVRLAGILLVLQTVAAAPAIAWSETGHRLVARIAWDAMPEPVRQEAAALVAEIEGQEFVEASVWLDHLRASGVHLFDRWHYIDLPIRDGARPRTMPAPHADNVVWAIATARRALASAAAPRSARAFALVSLLHLVGDIHQPLHAAARFDAAHPTGDRGGNDMPLADPWGNLHHLWDRMAQAETPGTSDDSNIARRATALRAAHPPSSLPQVSQLDPGLWASESHKLAVQLAYGDLEPGAAPSAAYLARARQAAQKRVVLAGYRLAAVIELALASAHNGSTTGS